MAENDLPDYLDCNNTKILNCDYFTLPTCPETCGYAIDIKGNNAKGEKPMNVGAMSEETAKGLQPIVGEGSGEQKKVRPIGAIRKILNELIGEEI